MINPSPNESSPMSWLLPIVVPLTAVVGILFGVIVLGKLAKEHLGDKGRVDFAAIECEPPLGMSSKDFLADVRYYSERVGKPLPDRLDRTDDLPKTLVEAFLRYPWVETIDGITIDPDNRVRVRLSYRRSVLAAQLPGEKRAVDARGAVLPKAAPTEGIPILLDGSSHADKADNIVWGDDRVKAAARTVAFLDDGQNKIEVTEVGGNRDELVLTTKAGARILWGHPPGGEVAGEPSAGWKRERLERHGAQLGTLDLRRSDD